LIEVIAIPEKVTIDNASTILNDYDIIVDGSDNFATRYLVNDTCVSLDKTLIYGSILGFEGQVAVLIIERVKPARLIS
jgi:adenylyltransferase/sulfurtransferase